MYCHFCFEFMNHGLIMVQEVKVLGSHILGNHFTYLYLYNRLLGFIDVHYNIVSYLVYINDASKLMVKCYG